MTLKENKKQAKPRFWRISQLKTGMGVRGFYKALNREDLFIVFKTDQGKQTVAYFVEATKEEDCFWNASWRNLQKSGKLSNVDFYLRGTFKPTQEQLKQALDNWNKSKFTTGTLIGGISLKGEKNGK